MSGPEIWRMVHQVGSTSGGKITSTEIDFDNPGKEQVFKIGLRSRRYIKDDNGKLVPLDPEHELAVKMHEIEKRTS